MAMSLHSTFMDPKLVAGEGKTSLSTPVLCKFQVLVQVSGWSSFGTHICTEGGGGSPLPSRKQEIRSQDKICLTEMELQVQCLRVIDPHKLCLINGYVAVNNSVWVICSHH